MGGKLSAHDLEALLEIFEASDWKEMHLNFGGSELFISKDPNARRQAAGAPVGVAAAAPAPAAIAAPAAHAAPAAAAPAAKGAAVSAPDGWVVVTAPSLGTFYRAPKPGAAPFTDISAKVTEDSELCLVEVMKLFTTLRAGTSGHVREIYAKDGELVEFGQPLFLIEPDA